MKHRKMVVYIGLQEFKRHLTTHKFQIGIFGIFKGHRVLQARPRVRSFVNLGTCSLFRFACKARARTISNVDVVTAAASTVNRLAQLMPASKRSRTVAYLSETLAVSVCLSFFCRRSARVMGRAVTTRQFREALVWRLQS